MVAEAAVRLPSLAAALPSLAAMTAPAPAPQLQLRLFAGLREAAGWGERPWPLQPGDTPARIWAALGLPGALESVRVAINQRFAAADTPLQPGDELAFLPPISGG
jgi:molybdopterin synthase sulfur carrier subunit